MDAVTILRERIDIDRLLEHYNFENIKSERNYIRACCKVHNGDNPTSFVFNRSNGLWWCHTGDCGGGDVFALVEKMQSLSFKQAVEWVANFYDVDISDMQIMERKLDYVKDIQKWIKMMQGKKKKKVEEFHINEEIKNVLEYKSFKPETLRKFGLGFASSVTLFRGDGSPYTLKNRLIFPIIFDDVQIALSLRRTKVNDVPKWSHQPANRDMGDYLYNYDVCKDKPTIVISEGITDVWAWWEVGVNAVACFGSHMTDMQYKLLLKTGADLVFAYDGDNAGRTAQTKAIGMFKNKANLKQIIFQDGEDPENIDRERLYEYFTNRQRC